jgi:hypothetical protein
MKWVAVCQSKECFFRVRVSEEKEACKAYLEGIPARRWAAHACPAKRYDNIASNMVEAMNAKWLRARELPPLHLLADLWMHAMKGVHERLHHPFESRVFTDHVLKEMEEEKEVSSRFVTAPFFLPRRTGLSS